MQPGRSNTRPAVSVFNFRVARWPGAMPEDDLNRFLTRRVGSSKKSMTHAVRAANGDCLRGQLVELRDEHVVFQSRFETLTLPRQNVVEIITLVPDLPPADAESQGESTARLRLWGGGTVTMHSLRANDELIQGQSPLVGAISLPWSAVAAIEFGGQGTGGSPFDRWVLRDPPKLPTPDESASQQATSPWLDKPAPEITLPVLDGEPIALAKLRGRPIVLDFWATWCGPCIGSMPTMMELADEFQGRVEFFAVNQQEDPDEVRDFLKARLWKLRVGLDEDGALGRTFGVEAIPYLLVIDAEGIVRHVHVGASPDLKDKLTAVLNDLLK
jgi:thiol-disulfide isomerase/thioredoxin